jgi:hypothetical protein
MQASPNADATERQPLFHWHGRQPAETVGILAVANLVERILQFAVIVPRRPARLNMIHRADGRNFSGCAEKNNSSAVESVHERKHLFDLVAHLFGHLMTQSR